MNKQYPSAFVALGTTRATYPGGCTPAPRSRGTRTQVGTRMRRAHLPLLLLLGVAACEQTPVILPEATSLVASPAEVAMIAGDMTALSGHVLDQRGHVLRGAQVSWTTDAAGVARVTPDGVVVGVAPGSTSLTASYGNLSVRVPVTVARDDRDLIQSIDFAESEVTTDRRAGPQFVGFRAYDARGRYRCDAPFQVQSSDRSVAVAAMTTDCRVRVEPVGPGTTTITLSANGITRSFVVNLTQAGVFAHFDQVPAASALFAGNAVTYRVRVVDAEDQPLPGQVINFEATAGLLATTSVTTDAEGYATTQWRLPRRLSGGDTYSDFENASIIFRTQLPGGAVVSRTDPRRIVPAAAARMQFHTLWGNQMRAVDGSASVPLNRWIYLLVEAHDEHGNRRDPSSILLSQGLSIPWQSLGWVDGRYYRYTDYYRWYEDTITVTAQDGDLSRDVEITFTAGS
jgi:hypothetical protein